MTTQSDKEREAETMTNEEKIKLVCSRYPDAYMRKYASLSMVIWCPMLKCRLSGFFHTGEEAWDDAIEWIKKKEIKKKGIVINSPEDLKKFIILKNGELMDIEEWTNTPVQKTEDAEFEIIDPKQLPNSQSK